MISLFLYRFPFTLLFLFRCCFRFLFPFPFLFRIPVSGFSRRPLFTHLSLSNTLRSTKDPNCARNVLLFGPLFISGKALQSWFTYDDSRENYFLMLFWFRSHGKTDLDSGPLADAMVQSTRSQEQKLPIGRPLLLKIACISLKQVHIKKILLVSPF